MPYDFIINHSQKDLTLINKSIHRTFNQIDLNYFIRSLKNIYTYINTGSWSTKAIKEAKMFGDVTEIGSSADKNFNYIPKDSYNYIVVPKILHTIFNI